MQPARAKRTQAGFSVLELLVVLGVMLTISAAAFSLLSSTLRSSTTTFEMTEAQESLRTAQEYLNRDLLIAGDGLKGISNIPVRVGFVSNYLRVAPETVVGNADQVILPIIYADHQVPAGTAVLGGAAAVNVRATPTPTDRLTLLTSDAILPQTNRFGAPVAITSITNGGLNVNIQATDANKFTAGSIYCITSENGATFGTLTAAPNISGSSAVLTFGSPDIYGLNGVNATSTLNVIGGGSNNNGTSNVTCSLTRILLIHYFVDANGLLIRRVFGLPGGISDSVIAEHVTNLQFRYLLNLPDANGNLPQPAVQFTAAQQGKVQQVEVTLTTETPHVVSPYATNANNQRGTVTMTTSTSIRNLQFQEAWRRATGS